MWRRTPRPLLLLGLVIGALFLGAGTARAEVTPGQAAVDQLTTLIMILAILMGLIVEGILIVAVLRFRRRESFHLPAPVKTGDPKLEFIWTALPILVIAIIGGGALYTLQVTDTIPEGTVYIDVIARQWVWEFRYPNGNLSEAILRVQANETIVLNITSQDVIHSYYVPAFRLKVDAVPGRVNQYWFRAEQVGEYVIQCAEFCGPPHYSMVGTLEVFPEGSQPLPYGPAP